MSIDKLIHELDKTDTNSQILRECADEIIGDYIGVTDAYVDLMLNYRKDPVKLASACKIIQELMNNLHGLAEIIAFLSNSPLPKEKIELLTGKILRGERNIDTWIQKFEGLEEQ